MDPVKRQYEAYPYPARDPAEEAKRLIEGSPSHPVEIDHFLFGGKRDWSKPFRALVAGGGTGDGLIMLAQKLADRRTPAEIVYLDMSEASRKVAEARAAARGLTSIRFLSGDLLTAPDHGPFDYVDCTGVLHHLPDPQAGFNALAAALAPGGGLGAMVYAPYGRTGVYPLQGALATLTEGEGPEAQVATAKAALKALPKTNWFGRNGFVGDHAVSDAG
ncbi:MAG: class I SAM-dependent methyltransferase, partial [Pseudomonadota bacterium]